MIQFYNPWKHQKIFYFLVCFFFGGGGMKWEHWVEKRYKKKKQLFPPWKYFMLALRVWDQLVHFQHHQESFQRKNQIFSPFFCFLQSLMNAVKAFRKSFY